MMTDVSHDTAAKLAWTMVGVIVSLLSVLSSSLLVLLDFPLVCFVVVSVGLTALVLVLIKYAYHVYLPSAAELRAVGDETELRVIARTLCIQIPEGSADLRRLVCDFVSAHEGKDRVWVAPAGLVSVMARILPSSAAEPLPANPVTRPDAEQSEGRMRSTKMRKLRRI